MAPKIYAHHKKTCHSWEEHDRLSTMADKNKVNDSFCWTDSEIELLLECAKVFASECIFEGKDCEGIKSKYEKIREIFVDGYPVSKRDNNENEDFPKSSSLNEVTKERIASKIKGIRQKFKKACDQKKRSGGGRVVMTYYDLCVDIWAGAPATHSMEGKCDILNIGLH